MKNVVMGTAGHIDHGKTALVKRLTGVDTDRLDEEKRRGMTIELGFAPLTLPSGNVISVIDVPGHEKFVKTMVAGVTGIDFVMLVIAADEGIMPQTKEHMDIISLLNIRSGVIALTKIDLVDEEWINLVIDDIKRSIKGTSLENFSIVPVSSTKGYGIDTLIKELECLSEKASRVSENDLFRMWIDRVFTISGHGTVITGTISGGKIKKGDTLEILPQGIETRIREIQVHNKSVDTAISGDRCALNIVGVEKKDVERGCVAVEPQIMKPIIIADAVIYAVKGLKGIVHNERVHVHIGTKEVLARIRLIGTDKISGGTKGYAQLRFEKPIAAIRGDKFIIRSYSPVTTIGGGHIIFHTTKNRKRYSKESIKAFEIGESGSLEEIVDYIVENSNALFNLHDLWESIFENKDEIERILNNLVKNGKAIVLRESNKYINQKLYKQYKKTMDFEFENLYKENPFKFKIDKEEIKSKLFSSLYIKAFNELINMYVKDGFYELNNNYIHKKDDKHIDEIMNMKETLLVKKAVYNLGLMPLNINKLKESLDIKPYKHEDILEFLIDTGEIMDLGSGIILHRKVVEEAVIKIKTVFKRQETVSLAEVRDCLNTSRKVALALLEYLDDIKVTVRQGDLRRPGVHFMDYFA